MPREIFFARCFMSAPMGEGQVDDHLGAGAGRPLWTA
jgi:hypothetical protein